MPHFLIVLVGGLLLLGAGCRAATPPPSYLKDAEAFSQLSREQISTREGAGVPVPPPAENVPTTSPAAAPVAVSPAQKSAAAEASPSLVAASPANLTLAQAGERYSQALNLYRGKGLYFQFLKCRGAPGSLTVKKGAQFMFDNRDEKEHVFKVGIVSYKIAPYWYAVVTARTLGTNYITCDGGGAAVVAVQP